MKVEKIMIVSYYRIYIIVHAIPTYPNISNLMENFNLNFKNRIFRTALNWNGSFFKQSLILKI